MNILEEVIQYKECWSFQLKFVKMGKIPDDINYVITAAHITIVIKIIQRYRC
jgi:hypothetical protein